MNKLIKGDKKAKPPVEVDSDITDAIGLIQASYRSNRRVKALANTREDKQIYEGLTDGLTNEEVFSQLKDTTLMQVVRLVSEDAYSLPHTIPTSAKEESETVLEAVSKIKQKYEVEGELKDAMRDLIEHACFMEGTSFLKIMPESYRDYNAGVSLEKLSFTRVDEAKVFYDPKCKSDISEGEWDADMETYGYHQAQEVAKNVYGFNGVVNVGDPLNVFDEKDGTGDDAEPAITTEGDIVFYTLRHKTKAMEVVFAGGDAQLMRKLEGVKKFPCKDKYGAPKSPLCQFNATAYKDGIHRSSFIGVAKDITRQQVKQWNSMLPHFERVNSPILAAMGAVAPEEFADNIAAAMEAQRQGLMGMVTLPDPQSRIDTIAPPDSSAAFERIMMMFDNALAKRLGLVLSVQEKQVSGENPTATQIIEQKTVHAKAIANLNKLNIKFFANVADVTVNYGRVLLKGSKEKFRVMLDSDAVELIGTDLVEVMKGWRGGWDVDTSIEIQLTKNEKVQVLTEFTKELTGYTQLLIMSEAEIKPIKDAVWAKITLLNFNEFFQSNEISEFFTSIATKNQQAQEQEQAAQAAQANQGGASQPAGSPPGETGVQDQAAALGAEAPQPGGAGI